MPRNSKAKGDFGIAELFLADSSRPSVRTAICVLFTVGGPLIAGIPMYFMDRFDFALYCSIAGPVTGLCGSILWLFWTWIRIDMQRNAAFVFRSHKRDELEGRHADRDFRRVVGLALDRAEKQSYVFVGLTLALSWLLSSAAVIVPLVAPSSAPPDVAAIERQMTGLSLIVKSQTSRLDQLERMSKGH